jgi:hypothetical protein
MNDGLIKLAAELLAISPSKDGSGHADISIRLLEKVLGLGKDEAREIVEGWKLKRYWWHGPDAPVTKQDAAPPELAELQAKYDQLISDAWAACGGNGPANREDLLTALRLMDEAEEELQATIARLESKLNRAINLDFERRAELERLKDGQGEPVAYRWRVKGHDNWVASVCKVEFGARANDDRFVAQALYTSQPAPVSVVSLRNFANSMIDIALEGGNADGAQIQELAVEHGLLKPEQRTERCGDTCSCAEYSDFPVECFRKVKELNQ